MDTWFVIALQQSFESISEFISSAITWLGSFANVVTSNAVIFIFVVAVPLVGLGIGLFKRMLSSN